MAVLNLTDTASAPARMTVIVALAMSGVWAMGSFIFITLLRSAAIELERTERELDKANEQRGCFWCWLTGIGHPTDAHKAWISTRDRS
jgi:hypothetical protein